MTATWVNYCRVFWYPPAQHGRKLTSAVAMEHEGHDDQELKLFGEEAVDHNPARPAQPRMLAKSEGYLD